MSALTTVGMLHDEYEKQFGKALGGPVERTEPLSTAISKAS